MNQDEGVALTPVNRNSFGSMREVKVDASEGIFPKEDDRKLEKFGQYVCVSL